MYATSQHSASRHRSASHSTDDHSSAKDKPRRFFPRYAHHLTLSSQSLAITGPHHDDLPTPSAPTRAPHATSTQSTPMTSPSIAHSSLLQGSLSSVTSESAPSPDSKHPSELGFLTRGSAAHSPIRGSPSSRSSHPVSPRSRSTTESDIQLSGPRLPRKCSSGQFSNRPSTAPYSPSIPTTPTVTDTPAEGHTRTPSRLATSIKNFLARPIITSPSRFSFNSVATTPSDSDASSRSHHVHASGGKWSMTSRKSRPPDLDISSGVGVAMPSPSRSSHPQIDIHRRYASEAAAKIFNARSGSGPLMSQESFDVPVQNESLPFVCGREHKPRNVLRRRPSSSAKLLKGPERGMNIPPRSPDSNLRFPLEEGTSQFGPVPLPLTPAGAVVEAYKQQELHRDDITRSPKLSIGDRISARASCDSGYDQEHSPTPYYTVFGTFSGRLVRAGGPDDRWSRSEAHPLAWKTSQDTPAHQASASDSGARTLTRQVSNRWRKIKGGGVASEVPSVRGRKHSNGRTSLQESRGEMADMRVTGRSIDGILNTNDGAWAGPTPSHARSGSEKGDGNEGGKFWRMVRRISTGGLRDRYQFDKVVPPVPAIPKELLKKMNQDEHHHELLSMSLSEPSSDSHDKDYTQTPTAPKNIADAQPSVATSSSSPNSSDVASMQFFHRSLSARSSVSSYGEAVVMPHTSEISIDQHIIAPLEQLRLGDDHAERGKSSASSMPKSRSPRRSVSVPAGLRAMEDNENDQALPPSPRRLTCSGDSPSSGSLGPSSTSAFGTGRARTSCQSQGHGVKRSRMEDGIVSLSPPPRAQRSTRRGGSESVASSPSPSIFVKQVNGGVRQMDRTPSTRSDMTARVESPEPEQSRDPDTSRRTRVQLTFRELDAPRRPPLSEREKADIWDDLLARSDKAGGTLHMNGAAELMSDNMRFSMHSEI